MNKLFSIICLLLITQITFAGHHESGHMKKGAVMVMRSQMMEQS